MELRAGSREQNYAARVVGGEVAEDLFIPAYQMKLLKPPMNSKLKELKALWERHHN